MTYEWSGMERRRVPFEDWGTIIYSDYGEDSAFLTVLTELMDDYDMDTDMSLNMYIEHHIPLFPQGAWTTDVHWRVNKHLALHSLDYIEVPREPSLEVSRGRDDQQGGRVE